MNLNNMNKSNMPDNQKSSQLSNSPIMAALAEKRKEAEALLATKFGKASPEYVDPLEAARASSPLLQYLDQSKQPPTLPQVEVDPTPPTYTARDFTGWDTWNPEAAFSQIKALGFEQGDKCYIRLLPAKNIPQQVVEKIRLAKSKDFYLEFLPFGRLKLVPYKWIETKELKPDGTYKFKLVADEANATESDEWWKVLARLNLKGYGVYLIPNKGGRKDKEITHFQSAFYEIDDRSFQEQMQLMVDFAQKTEVEPSVVVRTRKGYHVYFKFARSEWELPNWKQEIAKPTTFVMQSDYSIVSEANLMRLAGFHHVKYDSSCPTHFNFMPVNLLRCLPDKEYTREQYKEALTKYQGREFSQAHLDVLQYASHKSHSDYRYLDTENLLPLPHQIVRCPDDLIKELSLRTRLYCQLLKKSSLGEAIDETEAWTEDPGVVARRYDVKTYGHHSNVDWSGIQIEGEPNSVRWARYLYGYNPNGRDGWITAQDPTIPESEQDNHSLDSLHIHIQTGKYTSHRGGDTKEIYAAMKARAFAANPEEEVIYKQRLREQLKFQRQLDGEISKDEYKARGLKPQLTALEEQDKVIRLDSHQKAKQEQLDREFAEYEQRLKIDRNRVQKYYECNERYLSDETYAQFPTIAECNNKGQMLGLKAPKGTGKSQRIKQYIKEAKEACWLTISVTPRVNLGVAQAHEWDIPWIAESGIEEFVGDQKNQMSCCWDSLHKLYRKDYRDKKILFIIDEIESGLEHLCTSGTFKGKGTRAAVYNQLRRLIDHIQQHGGLIIGADADLTRIPLDFIQDVNGRLPISVIENTFVIPKKEIKVFFNKDGNVKAEIMQEIQDSNPFICACDSKDDVKDLYDYAVKHVRPEIKDKFWAIHAENVNEDKNQHRIKNFNQALKDEQPLGVFFSPTITVGISIDVEYFRMGFGNFKGSVTADVARQMVARNREILPWVIFADNLCDRKGEDTPTTPIEVKSKFVSQIKQQATLTQWMTEKLLREDQEKFGTDVEELEAQIRLIKTLTEDQRSIETAEFHLLGDVLAKQNFQKKYFHQCFIRGMESEGWKCVSKRGEKTGATEELKELREQRRKEESQEIANADHSHITSVDVARDILSTAGTRAERIPADKVVLADKARLDPDELKPDIVLALKYDPRYLPGIRRQWYLQNWSVIERIDARRMVKLIKDLIDLELCSPQDATGESTWIDGVNKCGIFEIIDLDDDERDYKWQDFQPVIDKLKYLSSAKLEEWAKSIGISWDAKKHKRAGLFKNPIRRIVKPILEKLGYDFVKAKKSKKGQNSYKIPAEQINDPIRARILEALTQDEAEKQAQIELEKTALVEGIVKIEPSSTVSEAPVSA